MQVPYHYIGLNIHKRTIAFCEKRVDGQTVGAGAFGATAFYNHVPGGSNVLYLDGHVEFVRFPDSRDRIPYTWDFVEWVRANTYDNHPLLNVPPWCSNRPADVNFRPRYYFYPNDPLYEDLIF